MNYMNIRKASISEGPGVRTVIFVSGCNIHCKGCHNPEAQCFTAGNKFTDETITEVLTAMNHEYITGLTLCGGEPLDRSNQEGMLKLCIAVHNKFPDKSIWCYTGYEYTDLQVNGKAYTLVTQDLLDFIDVLVAGPFIETLRDVSDANRWRGSINQRIIDVKKTLQKDKIVYLDKMPNNK